MDRSTRIEIWRELVAAGLASDIADSIVLHEPVPHRLLVAIGRNRQCPARLPPSERLVMQGYVDGGQVKTIAAKLGKSAATVKRQSRTARQRLGARNTTHAVAMLLRAGELRYPERRGLES